MKLSSAIRGFGIIAGSFVLALSLHAEDTAHAPHAKNTAAAKKAALEKTGEKKAAKKRGALAGGAIAGRGRSSGILTEAYGLLEHADHDYKGHRAAAMRQVKVAAELVGQRVGTRGGGNEVQGASDEQLRRAQTLLEQASGSLSGAALEHVHTAVQELSTALAVR